MKLILLALFAMFCAAVHAQSSANGATSTNNVRPLTLKECIQLALEHNLDCCAVLVWQPVHEQSRDWLRDVAGSGHQHDALIFLREEDEELS